MEIAKQSARGSSILFAGNFVATLILAVASILVARLLGPNDFGLYSLALVMPQLLQLLTHFGTRTAVTKYVANYVALGDLERARRFAQSAMVFSVVAGGAFAAINYLASGFVASVLLQRPEIQPYIALASILVFGQSIMLTTIAGATGWNAWGQASFANVLQGALKLAIAPSLVILGFGISGAVVGQASSFVIGGIFSASLLFFTRVKFTRERLGYLFEDTKELVRFGFQPFVGGLLTGLSLFYVSVLLANVASNTLVGYYQAATNLIIPATLLAMATTSALYPAFASLHATKADTGQAFSLSVKYVAFLIGPVLFFLAAAAPQMMYLYGDSFVPGSRYLFFIALAYTPILIGQTVVPSFFNGVGRPKLTFYATGIAAVLLFVVAPLFALAAGLGVDGLILSLFLSNFVLAGAGLFLARRHRLGGTNWRSTLATLAASLVALGGCLALPAIGDELAMLGVKIIVFGGIYLTLAPVLGAVNLWDLERLGESVRDVPVVGRVASPFIGYERALVRLAKGVT